MQAYILVFALLAHLACGQYIDITSQVSPTWVGGSYAGYLSTMNGIYSNPANTTIGALSPLWAMFRLMSSIAVEDVNQDGWEDFYVSNAEGHANSLYINQGVGLDGLPTFVDQASSFGLELTDHGSSTAIFGDFNNDGFPDLVVSSYNLTQSARLMKNNGDGTFTDVTMGSGLEFTQGSTTTNPTLGDVNNDGFLDIYFANSFNNSHKMPVYIGNHPSKQANLLFINNGISGFNFSLVPFNPDPNRITWAASMIDYDQDGHVDVIHANDQAAVPPMPPAFQQGFMVALRNLGNGTLTDDSVRVGFRSLDPLANIPLLGAWMSVDGSDLNCDGTIDISATNLGGIPYHFLSSGMASCSAESTTWFMQDPATGKFVNAYADGMVMPFGWGGVMPDVDNDGDRDQCFVGGMGDGMYPGPTVESPFTCIENIDYCTGKFRRNTIWEGSINRMAYRDHPLAIADFNRDRKADLITASEDRIPDDQPLTNYPIDTCTGPYINDNKYIKGPVNWLNEGQDGCAFNNRTSCVITVNASKAAEPGALGVFLNTQDNNNGAISVLLAGGKGVIPSGTVNRDGYGATVIVTPRNLQGDKNAVGKTTKVPLTAGNSFASQSSRRLIFGLGQYNKADIEILWPGGHYNALYGVPTRSDQFIREIPCDFKTASSMGALVTCITNALNEYGLKGPERSNILNSNIQAYLRTH